MNLNSVCMKILCIWVSILFLEIEFEQLNDILQILLDVLSMLPILISLTLKKYKVSSEYSVEELLISHIINKTYSQKWSRSWRDAHKTIWLVLDASFVSANFIAFHSLFTKRAQSTRVLWMLYRLCSIKFSSSRTKKTSTRIRLTIIMMSIVNVLVALRFKHTQIQILILTRRTIMSSNIQSAEKLLTESNMLQMSSHILSSVATHLQST